MIWFENYATYQDSDSTENDNMS
uniref:Uncharacterized protein n=1 Tax=Arundo donax TaxID=35708 RepID=A0A0A8ZED0_ARUDO